MILWGKNTKKHKAVSYLEKMLFLPTYNFENILFDDFEIKLLSNWNVWKKKIEILVLQA